MTDLRSLMYMKRKSNKSFKIKKTLRNKARSNIKNQNVLRKELGKDRFRNIVCNIYSNKKGFKKDYNMMVNILKGGENVKSKSKFQRQRKKGFI